MDFLFSFANDRAMESADALTRYCSDQRSRVKTFTGDWGTFVTIGDAYPGFAPIENDQWIIAVIGGPLPRFDDSVAAGVHADDGTLWILERWKSKYAIKWDEDLLGHFLIVCIDKTRYSIEIVTDINAFVPWALPVLACEKPLGVVGCAA